MIAQPLFWLYLFCLFNLFIYLTNRVSFHPRWGVSEHLWIDGWTVFFLAAFAIASLLLYRAWACSTTRSRPR